MGHGKCLHLLTMWVSGIKKGQNTLTQHLLTYLSWAYAIVVVKVKISMQRKEKKKEVYIYYVAHSQIWPLKFTVKSKGKILQNFVAFSEYMNLVYGRWYFSCLGSREEITTMLFFLGWLSNSSNGSRDVFGQRITKIWTFEFLQSIIHNLNLQTQIFFI